MKTCLALIFAIFVSSISSASTSTSNPSPTKHLVLDSRIIDHVENAKLSQGTIEKDTHNPVFHADKPWENALNNLYPNIAYDSEQERFKLWYKCVLFDKDVIAKMMPPATVHDVGWFLLYATSRDGIAWEKPDVNQIGFDGSTHNNIVARDTPNVGVFKDDHDPDVSRRYKMIYDIGLGKMHVRFSPDGIRWSDKIAAEGLPATGDTHNNAFWDARLQKYVLFTRQLPNHQRNVFRSESTDFVHWSSPSLAVPPDSKKRQSYCMTVFPYGDGYIGLVMMYNAGTDQTVDCELAWSPDSITWTRPFARQPFIPRGAAGGYDAGCIYAQANPPIVRDGRLLIFYGGSTAVHKGWKRHCLPCLSRIRIDGFACYEPQSADKTAIIETKPISIGRAIRITADAAGGSVRVGVIGENGFAIEDCEAINANVTDAEIHWRGKTLSSIKGKSVRLRFELNHAKLYAFDAG